MNIKFEHANSLPMPTWRWLKLNDTTISYDNIDKLTPLKPQIINSTENISLASQKDITFANFPHITTGIGSDADNFVVNNASNKNYFTMPNEIFSLGLDASEIAVYAYLRCLESRSTYQCWPSYTTIGNAVGRAKNTVMRYVDALADKGLISTEPTSLLTRSGIKKNGNLRYTIRPIREAIEIFHARQLSAVERAAERQQIQRKLSAMDMLPGA